MAFSVTYDNYHSVNLRGISIRNYKGIEHLSMEFPAPRLDNDPDLLVIGSENGFGKTSVIECCALLLMGLELGSGEIYLRSEPGSVDIADLLIHAGARYSEIVGSVEVNGERTIELSFRICREQTSLQISGIDRKINMPEDPATIRAEVSEVINRIIGVTSHPLTGKYFQLFHGYRKIQEIISEQGIMLRDTPAHGKDVTGYLDLHVSDLKSLMHNALIGSANLFEIELEVDSEETIDCLDELIECFAGATISSMGLSEDDLVEIRLAPNRGGGSFDFDGLSSGQKQIISTLFLIWYYSKVRSSVVLIDSPELHLNHQWHRRFVNKVMELAPHNQYVMATHSVDIMGSVPPNRRTLITKVTDSADGSEISPTSAV